MFTEVNPQEVAGQLHQQIKLSQAMAILRILTVALATVMCISATASAQLLKDGPFRRMFTKPPADEAADKKTPAPQTNRAPAKMPEYPRTTQRSSNSPTERHGTAPQSSRHEAPSLAPQLPLRSDSALRVPTPAPTKPLPAIQPYYRQNEQTPTNQRLADERKVANDQLRMFGAIVQQRDHAGPIMVLNAPEASDAYRAGLRRGDELVSVGGIELEDLVAIEGIEGLFKPGDQVSVVVQRNRKEQKINLVYRPNDVERELANQPERALSISDADASTQNEEAKQVHVAPREQMRSLFGSADASAQSSRNASSVNADSQANHQLLIDSIQQLRDLVQEQEAEIQRLENELRKFRNSSLPVRRR